MFSPFVAFLHCSQLRKSKSRTSRSPALKQKEVWALRLSDTPMLLYGQNLHARVLFRTYGSNALSNVHLKANPVPTEGPGGSPSASR